jgi:hypothetical protein
MTLLSWSGTVLGAGVLCVGWFAMDSAARSEGPRPADWLLAGLLLAVISVGIAILHHLRRLERGD